MEMEAEDLPYDQDLHKGNPMEMVTGYIKSGRKESAPRMKKTPIVPKCMKRTTATTISSQSKENEEQGQEEETLHQLLIRIILEGPMCPPRRKDMIDFTKICRSHHPSSSY